MNAVILDAANTILDNPTGFSPRAKAAELLGLPSEQRVRNLVYSLSADQPGMSCEEFVNALVMRSRGEHNASIARQLRDTWLHYNSVQILRPDALPVIGSLRERGFRLGLLPNCTPFFRPLCDQLRLEKYFDAICLSCEIGFLKPDPRAFLYTMDQLGSTPQHTCVVGDKVKTDIVGGTMAGCTTVLMEVRCAQPLSGDRLPLYAVINELSQLLSLPILQWRND